MKRHIWVMAFVVYGLLFDLKAQSVRSFAPSAAIEPYRLEVSYHKTTHLVFPYSIIGMDRGSAGILAQKADGVDNILKVKAGHKDFEETNLSVITSDGKLYSFLVSYSERPAFLNINVVDTARRASVNVSKQVTPFTINEAVLGHYAKAACQADKNIKGVSDGNARISLSVEGIYVKESVLFLRLRLQNKSAINYNIDQFRLFVRVKVQSKRTAIQEREVVPLHTTGDTAFVKANSAQNIVLAIPALTIPDGKYLAVEMTEEAGGRHLFLKLKNKHLLKAQPLD